MAYWVPTDSAEGAVVKICTLTQIQFLTLRTVLDSDPFSFLASPVFFFPPFAVLFILSGNGANIMAKYVTLLQFTDQGIRNVKDTMKRSEAATAEAEKMGIKITDVFWTMGAYDVVVLLEAADDETISAFALKIGSLGNSKTHTMRAFSRGEMEKILARLG